MTEPMIVAEDVWKSYPAYHALTGGIKGLILNLPRALRQLAADRFEAIKGLSFEIARGECFGIMGHNGAGKSTLLGLIAGVIRPTRGRLAVRGRVTPLLELGAGFHPDLSARENIILNGVLLGMSRKEIMSKLDAIIDFSELRQFIDQPIRTFSTGMVARTGFSVAIHAEPDVLLIDEILAVGDEHFQKKCAAKMNEMKAKNVTIVLVSHDAALVESFCGRILTLDHGAIQSIRNVGR